MEITSALGNLGNLGDINKFNVLNQHNKIFKQNLEELKSIDGGISINIGENIFDNPKVQQDKQLSDDLKLLLGQNDQSIRGFEGTSDLSASKLAEGFGNILENSINKLNKTQLTAEKAVETFASGGDIDVHTVMIESRKAELSMQLALKMQSKLMQAYQEVSKMQV
ncbi:MAG: flagellar hook-basal body complex protein FliE [Candidatus Gastranaerophilales bacterium]|nr:flagellar hook-basal body complex protein FliE [Candidatus Gastranaerophilales bacterium]